MPWISRELGEWERCELMNLGLEIKERHGLQTHLNLKSDFTGRRERMLEMISLGKMQAEMGLGGLGF